MKNAHCRSEYACNYMNLSFLWLTLKIKLLNKSLWPSGVYHLCENHVPGQLPAECFIDSARPNTLPHITHHFFPLCPHHYIIQLLLLYTYCVCLTSMFCLCNQHVGSLRRGLMLTGLPFLGKSADDQQHGTEHLYSRLRAENVTVQMKVRFFFSSFLVEGS